MECRYTTTELVELLNRQIKNYWTYDFIAELPKLESSIKNTFVRLEACLKILNNKYINMNNITYFKIEHSVSYAIYLYILSNELYKAGNTEGASYVYYLNKIMHSVDWFYAIDLPEHFGAEHPLGCVLGRARYGDYFFVYQGCTIGGNLKKGNIHYPQTGNNLLMYANSTIIGDSYIGNNVIVSANCFIKDENIPDNCIVFGESPNLKIKVKTIDEMRQMLGHFWRRR